MRVIAFLLLVTILLALIPSEATEIEVNSVGESVQKDSNPFRVCISLLIFIIGGSIPL